MSVIPIVMVTDVHDTIEHSLVSNRRNIYKPEMYSVYCLGGEGAELKFKDTYDIYYSGICYAEQMKTTKPKKQHKNI